VTFQRYAGLEQDEHGIWVAPSGASIAWFKDPDGNTLSLTEFERTSRSQRPTRPVSSKVRRSGARSTGKR
jgi:hypothetical protein